MKYKFKLEYTNDDKYTKEIEADNPIDAWRQFNEWVEGFISSGSGGFLETVKVIV